MVNKITPPLSKVNVSEKIADTKEEKKVLQNSSQEVLQSADLISVLSKTTDTKVKMDPETRLGLEGDLRAKKAEEDEAMLLANQLKSMADSLTSGDVKELEEEKSPYEEYTEKTLERAITRVKEGRKQRKEALEGAVEKKELTREQNEKVAITIAMAERARGNFSDSAKEYILKNEMPVNVAGIYMASYAATAAQSENVSKPDTGEVWTQIKPQVDKTLLIEGVPESEDVSLEARWLFDRDIDISARNVARLKGLNEFDNFGLSEADRANIDDAAKIGENPAEADITSALKKEAGYITNRWNLITATRKMYETSYKMSEESALLMLKKGIKVDLGNMAGVVKALKEEEEKYYTSLLKEAGAPTGEVQKESLKEALEYTREVALHSAFAAGKVYASEGSLTLADAGHEIKALSENAAAYRQMAADLESVGTQVRADLGDSIKKAFKAIGSLLKENGIDDTAENERATRILGYNNLEINEENITRMKYYYALVTQTTKALKPAVVARMIKEGLNPSNMTFDKLYSEAGRISESLNTSEKDEAVFLYNLERNNEINADERKAYIGIYRLLRQIEKSDGAAIGAAVNAGAELTLGSLLTFARTAKRGHFDKTVDNSAGEKTKGGYTNSITESIDAAFARLEAARIADDASTLTEDFARQQAKELANTLNTSDDTVRFLARYGIEVTPLTLEAAKEMLEGESKGGARRLSKFVKSLGRSERHVLAAISDEMLDSVGKGLDLAKSCELFNDEATEMVNKQIQNDDISFESIQGLKTLRGMFELQTRLVRNEHYEMPVVDDDGNVNMISLTVRHRGTGEGRMTIKAQNADHTDVSAQLWLEKDGLTGAFACEDKEVLAGLTEHLKIVNANINSAEGIRMGTVQRLYMAAEMIINKLR